MSSAAEALPPALLVAGSDGHRRRQFVRQVTRHFVAAGGSLMPLEGGNREDLARIQDSVGVLYVGATMVVVSEPEKLKLEDLADHLAGRGSPELTFLLVYPEDKPAGEVAAAIPPGHRKVFGLPPSYKLEEHATEFALQEARAAGLGCPAALAGALVRRVGTDLGVVHFEMEKAFRLMRARGDTLMTPEIVRETVAPLVEMDGTLVVEALARRDRHRVAEELHRYYQSKKGEPTVELCGRTLTPTFLRWFQAAHLAQSGLSPAVAAGRLGVNPWYWEHKVLPPALAWGRAGTVELLSVVARAQEAVFAGMVSPWRLLGAGLLRLLPPPVGAQ